MSQVWSTQQRQVFCQQLFAAAQDLIPNQPIQGSDASVQHLATLTKLVIRSQETLRALKVSQPLIIAILSGMKILYLDGQAMTFEAGDLFVVPANMTLNVINQPALKGEYVALVLELSANLLNRVRHAYPELINSLSNSCTFQGSSYSDLRVALSPLLVDALVHLVRATAHSENQSSILNEHHLMEIVLLLLQSNVQMTLLQAIYPDFATLIRFLIRSDLSSNWSLDRLAQALDMSVSTLKRRLQEVDLSFRQLLDEERMSRAMDLLSQNHLSIAQISLACGYESQSRFASRFRKYYSINPSDVRSSPTRRRLSS